MDTSRKKNNTNHSNMQGDILKLQKTPIQDIEEFDSTGQKISKNRVFLSRVKRKVFKHVYLVRGFLLVLAIAGLIVLGVLAWRLIGVSKIGFYVTLAKNFIFAPADKATAIGGRTNILILGKGGEEHDAPDLTDTIIFTSLKHDSSDSSFEVGSGPEISMIALPRDIWIAPLRAKLNSVYYWGNQKQPENGGLVLAKSVVEEVVGKPVQYGIVIDFSGFRKIIDVLGGIEVDVENSFTDSQFPIVGRENDPCGGDSEYKCRYETISFQKGLQLMDGETALKFVRSRHAEGAEGTDLARAARQEKVIAAMRNKVLSTEILLKPKKVVELKNAVLDSIETDITPETTAVLARLFLKARENINSTVLLEDLLENPPKLPRYDNLYVFIPKEIDESDPTGRSWSKVQEWVECELESGTCN